MSFNRYRWCIVSNCRNTSNRTPDKLFIQVPAYNIKKRNTWLQLAKRDPKLLSIKSRLYLCEDHFNLEQDMENYMEYKLMGSVKHIRMKVNATPSRFNFRSEKKSKLSPSTSQTTVTNTKKLDFVQETESSAKSSKSGIKVQVY